MNRVYEIDYYLSFLTLNSSIYILQKGKSKHAQPLRLLIRMVGGVETFASGLPYSNEYSITTLLCIFFSVIMIAAKKKKKNEITLK